MKKEQIYQKAVLFGLALAISAAPFVVVGSALAASFEPVESSAPAITAGVSSELASLDRFSGADVLHDESVPATFHTEAAKETSSPQGETSSAVSSAASSGWTEQAMQAKTMRTILPCFSREKAQEGTKVIETLAEGQTVTAMAKTSTNYIKIKEGGYIYADFLEDAPKASASSKAASSSKQSSGSSSSKGSSAASQGNKAPSKPVVHDGTVQGILNAAPLHPRKTGFSSLDNKIRKIFDKIFTPDMDTYSKVKACYDYLIKNTTYGRVNYPTTGFGSISPEGGDNYIAWAASSCLDNGVATCNRYSAAFIAMVRTIGLDARYVDGKTSAAAGGFIGHVWVEVYIGGTAYVFDPQVEDNITGSGTIRYQRFCKTYSQVPNKYIKS